MRRFRVQLIGLLFIVAGGGFLTHYLSFAADPAEKKPEIRGPLSAQQELETFRIDSGLKIELVAAEPEIESPVAMAFDEDGKLWVVEMRDYPNGPAPGQPPAGRIKVLEDKDGDGRYEHATVFADQLLFANGLMPWKGGVIVTAAPHIIYLRDNDGDGKADQKDILFEGFTAKNPQLRVNHPMLGPDNWVYVANGILGGVIKRSGKVDAKPVNINNMDFRFNPHNPDQYEAVSGFGQFGHTFNDWGQRFACTNRDHLIPIVLPDRYVKRNPYLAVPSPPKPNQGPGGAAKIYPLSRHWTTLHLHHGTFTSSCSVFIYRGDLLPEKYRGAAFTCEPAGNLIHQEILTPNGASFDFKPPKEGVEFFATPDEWCRPVFLADGPDGALYFVDMYRAVIEHPEYMPVELRKRPDLNLGKERGRIWRIIPAASPRTKEGSGREFPRVRLSKWTAQPLVDSLSHPDAWWRTTAHRLLLERSEAGSIRLLLAKTASAKEPLARVHAAWLLNSQNALDEQLVLELMRHEHAGVREHAVQFAERWLAASAQVQDAMFALADDLAPRVRFQVALSLGAWDDDRILEPLARIALANVDDRWSRLAVGSAVPKRAGALIAVILKQPTSASGSANPNRLKLIQEMFDLVGGRHDPQEVAVALKSVRAVKKAALQMAALIGLIEGMGRRGVQLDTIAKSLAKDHPQLVEELKAMLNQAAELAQDGQRSLPDRREAIQLLAHAEWPTARPALVRLMDEDPQQEIRLAAVRALSNHSQAEVADLLLKSWKEQMPAMRREVTEALLKRPDRIKALLDRIESGEVRQGDLDPSRVRQLLSNKQPEIGGRAKKLLKDNTQERKQILDRYKAALKIKADAKRGREVFQKNCATCHQMTGIGVNVGPDISDTRVKTPEQLLTDILLPNQAIDNNYVNYVVRTKNGTVFTGLIASETASNIVLKRAENQTDTILRQDIEEIQSTSLSLMPEDVEKNISIEEMANLIAFLKNWRYLDGSVPLGQ